MPDIRLDVAVPAIAVLLAALLAGAFAFWSYRSTLPAVSPGRRALLMSLRGTALFLILLVLLEPVLHLNSSTTELPRIAVLMDNSKSMRIVDHAGARSAILDSLLRADGLRTLGRKASLRYYTFGVGLRPFDPPERDSLRFSEEGTDLSTALRSLQREQAVHHLDAALLLSDGTYTLGQNPLYAAEELGLPLFAVGIGDSAEQKDLLVTGVLANGTAFSGTPTPVDVRIRSSGFSSESTVVRLFQGTRELARATLRLEPGTHEYSVPVVYTPMDEGRIRYTAEVLPLHGELTELNNRKSFVVRVLKSKLRLLVLAGSPGPDLTVLRQTLQEEKNFAVQAFAARPSGGFYEGQMLRESVDSADCLILLGFPSAGAGESILQWISGAAERNTPLLFIAGKSLDYSKLQEISAWLPFTVDLPSPVERMVSPQVSPSFQDHPLLTLERSDAFAAWPKLPPIYQTLTVFRARAESMVLATTLVDGVPVQDPLLLARSLGRQRTVALLGYGIWRWKLMTQGDPQTAGFYSDFVSTSIRWLTSPPDARQLRVQPLKDVFVQGEPADFLGQVYDPTMKPRDDARVTVSIRSGDRVVDVDLQQAGNGRYEGSLDGLGEGEYTYRATAHAGEQTVGQDSGRFSVGEPSLEFQDTRAMPSILQRLAQTTGGVFLSPARFDSISEILTSRSSLAPHTVQRSTRVELWNWQITLLLVVLLLAAEWILRRKSGML
jgi:hypothetical protein